MQISRSEISNIPTEPGCYLFKAESGEDSLVIYVGKAKNLRARVRQYFTSDSDTRPFVEFIRDRTTSIEYIVTQDEENALLLENELIKRHKPIYNIFLKDDKRYLSLRLDLSHEWPRVEIVRKVKKDKAVYLGPFSSSFRLRETLNIMQKIFPLRSCPDRKLYNRSRPCIEYDIKRCVAPCVNYCSREEYKALVDAAVLFLKGKNEELLSGLELEMSKKAEQDKFEEAAKLRDQIYAIQQITQASPSVIAQKFIQSDSDVDVFGVAQMDAASAVFALFIRAGVVWDQRSFEFSGSKLDESEVLSQVISRYYSSEVFIPKEVWVDRKLEIPGLPDQLKVIVPRTEEKIKLVETATKNASERIKIISDKKNKISKILDKLQSKLVLSRYPKRMDCIDISHYQGEEVVASVVRFEDGIPNKNFYRKIKMKTDQVDDFASMKEAIERRYKVEADLPELLVVDGGRGQLSSVLEIFEKKNWINHLDIVSLAKARPTSEAVDPLNPMNRERIFKPGQKNPILLKEGSAEELLLTYLRDEAHRFAITYHRNRKLKSISFSVLDEVEGISSRLKLRLLKTFGSIEGIKSATDYELLKVVKAPVLEALRQRLSEIKSEEDSADAEEE